MGPTWWRRNSKEVATPKLGPAPRIPQKRSGCSSSLTVMKAPSAVTRSTERRLSQASPYFRISQPSPPPRVNPAMPVVETKPPRSCQVEDAALTVKLAPRHPSLSPDGVLRRIDANTFHGAEVDDHAAVDKCSPRNIVATAADSHKDAMRSGKVDGIDDVGNSGALNDQCWVFVDERIVVPSGHIVVRITRAQYP